MTKLRQQPAHNPAARSGIMSWEMVRILSAPPRILADDLTARSPAKIAVDGDSRSNTQPCEGGREERESTSAARRSTLTCIEELGDWIWHGPKEMGMNACASVRRVRYRSLQKQPSEPPVNVQTPKAIEDESFIEPARFLRDFRKARNWRATTSVSRSRPWRPFPAERRHFWASCLWPSESRFPETETVVSRDAVRMFSTAQSNPASDADATIRRGGRKVGPRPFRGGGAHRWPP